MGCLFDRFRDGAAERTGGVRVLGQNLAADFGGHGRGRDNIGIKHLHDGLAEGLLLIGALDHVDLAVQAQVAAGHGQGRAPLAGAGLGGQALDALLLGIICLSDGRIELVAARGVVAFELVIDLRRGLQLFLQTVGSYKR